MKLIYLIKSSNIPSAYEQIDKSLGVYSKITDTKRSTIYQGKYAINPKNTLEPGINSFSPGTKAGKKIPNQIEDNFKNLLMEMIKTALRDLYTTNFSNTSSKNCYKLLNSIELSRFHILIVK